MMLWSVSLLPLLMGAVLAVSGTKSRRSLALSAAGVTGITLALAVMATMSHWTGTWQWSDSLALSSRLTPLSSLVAILVPLVALPVTVNAALNEQGPGLARLVGLMLVFMGGMQLVVIANDLLTVLMGWELIGACSWALIAHDWRNREAPASALYAFVTTRFGDLGLFVAVLILYRQSGSLSFDAIAALDPASLQIVAFALLLSAMAKAGQLPFSAWLFRAMAGPASVSALLHAATLVAAGAYLLARLEPMLSQAAGFNGVTMLIGLVTALAGGVVAIVQPHAKKVLAASTSAQLGFMFVAIGAGYPAVAMLHLVIHALYKAPLFMATGLAGHQIGSYQLRDMQLGRTMPLAGALSAIAAIALAGIPPSGGGWSKELIVAAAGHANGWIAIGMIAAGGLSAAYATRFIMLAFAPGEQGERAVFTVLPIGILSGLTLLASVFWWEPASRWIGAQLTTDLPPGTTMEFAASVLTLAAGVLVGQFLARQELAKSSAVETGLADWLGVPGLIRRAVTDPVDALARNAALVDDRVIDRLPQAVAQFTILIASRVAQFDDRQVDRGTRLTASASLVIARRVAQFDDRQVDRGIRLTASASLAMARLSETFGELWLDRLPEGIARVIGTSGRDARELQSGMSHHYYAILISGFFLIAIILIGA